MHADEDLNHRDVPQSKALIEDSMCKNILTIDIAVKMPMMKNHLAS